MSPEPVSPNTMKSRIRVRNRVRSNAPAMRVSSSGAPFGATADPSTVRQGMNRFEIGRQRAEPRAEAIRGHEHGVRAEQGRYLVLVGLELVEGSFEGGVLVTGVLQLRSQPTAGR